MTFSLAPHVTATGTEHGTVLLDQRRGRYFQINTTGGLILRTLLCNGSPEHAATVLTEHYGITVQQARSDVAGLLNALTAAQLVTT
ncbi:lasso peptide biosynthesis PqqD family chaperone [Streptomyces sp. URMC 127]|uniref:lasso peptide biosynthesis PqqD family chaperone n=1 Tax=Streptomyces sp. URMC 127 TaxID=3423402 RepID=UPI003F1D80AE